MKTDKKTKRQLKDTLSKTHRRKAEPEASEAKRKPTEETLPESLKRYRILDNLMEGCQIIGFDWRYFYVNDTVARHGRRTKDELLGHTMMEVYPGIENTDMFAALRHCMKERTPSHMENEFTYPDGTKGFFELSIQPFPEGIFILSIDITERKRAEDKLRETTEKFRTLIQASPLAVIAFSLDSKVMLWNKAAERIFGWREEEVIGKTNPIVPKEKREEYQTFRNRVLQGKSFADIETTRQKKDGSIINVSFSAAPLRDAQGKITGIIAVVADITERKRTEEEVRKVNRALRVLGASNQILVRAEDEAGLLRDICRIVVEEGGYCLAWVGFAEQDRRKSVRPVAQAGFEKDYLDTLNITWADIPRGRGPTGTAIRTGQPIIARNIKTDPAFAPWRAAAIKRGYASSIALPLITNGRALGTLNIYANEPGAFDAEEVKLLRELADDMAYGIAALRFRSEREQKDKALRESARKWRTTFDAIGDAVCLLDRKRKILQANKSMSNLLKKPFNEIIGNTCCELLHGKLEPITDCPVKRMEETRRRETMTLSIDSRWFDISTDPVLDESGNLIGAVHILTDITEHKQAEAMLTRAMEELSFDRQRMEELAKQVINAQEKERLYLASEIHDDLLQGLVATSYFLEMLNVSSFDQRIQERKEKLIEILKASIDSGRNLLAEIAPIKEPQIGLIQAVEKAIGISLADTGTTVTFAHPKKILVMSPANTTNILRIVQEALMNIRKHAKATEVSLKIATSKGELSVETKDNGVGFDLETVSRSIVGHYGLLTMQERARLIGGELTVASQPGKGTVVKGTFPLKQK